MNQAAPGERSVSVRSRWRWLAVIVVLVAAVASLSWLGERVPAREWGERIARAGAPGALALLVLGAAGTSIGLPRQLIALIAGYAYGVLAGLVVALGAAILGCALSVLAGRRWLARPVARRFPTQVDWLRRFARRDTFLKILVLRLQPFGTNLLSNLAAGVIRLPLRVYLAASLVGYVPQTLVFVLVGSGVRVGSSTELVLATVLLGVSLLIGGWLWRRHGQFVHHG